MGRFLDQEYTYVLTIVAGPISFLTFVFISLYFVLMSAG